MKIKSNTQKSAPDGGNEPLILKEFGTSCLKQTLLRGQESVNIKSPCSSNGDCGILESNSSGVTLYEPIVPDIPQQAQSSCINNDKADIFNTGIDASPVLCYTPDMTDPGVNLHHETSASETIIDVDNIAEMENQSEHDCSSDLSNSHVMEPNGYHDNSELPLSDLSDIHRIPENGWRWTAEYDILASNGPEGWSLMPKRISTSCALPLLEEHASKFPQYHAHRDCACLCKSRNAFPNQVVDTGANVMITDGENDYEAICDTERQSNGWGWATEYDVLASNGPEGWKRMPKRISTTCVLPVIEEHAASFPEDHAHRDCKCLCKLRYPYGLHSEPIMTNEENNLLQVAESDSSSTEKDFACFNATEVIELNQPWESGDNNYNNSNNTKGNSENSNAKVEEDTFNLSTLVDNSELNTAQNLISHDSGQTMLLFTAIQHPDSPTAIDHSFVFDEKLLLDKLSIHNQPSAEQEHLSIIAHPYLNPPISQPIPEENRTMEAMDEHHDELEIGQMVEIVNDQGVFSDTNAEFSLEQEAMIQDIQKDLESGQVFYVENQPQLTKVLQLPSTGLYQTHEGPHVVEVLADQPALVLSQNIPQIPPWSMDPISNHIDPIMPLTCYPGEQYPKQPSSEHYPNISRNVGTSIYHPIGHGLEHTVPTTNNAPQLMQHESLISTVPCSYDLQNGSPNAHYTGSQKVAQEKTATQSFQRQKHVKRCHLTRGHSRDGASTKKKQCPVKNVRNPLKVRRSAGLWLNDNTDLPHIKDFHQHLAQRSHTPPMKPNYHEVVAKQQQQELHKSLTTLQRLAHKQMECPKEPLFLSKSCVDLNWNCVYDFDTKSYFHFDTDKDSSHEQNDQEITNNSMSGEDGDAVS